MSQRYQQQQAKTDPSVLRTTTVSMEVQFTQDRRLVVEGFRPKVANLEVGTESTYGRRM
jgi:hypothetical protein